MEDNYNICQCKVFRKHSSSWEKSNRGFLNEWNKVDNPPIPSQRVGFLYEKNIPIFHASCYYHGRKSSSKKVLSLTKKITCSFKTEWFREKFTIDCSKYQRSSELSTLYSMDLSTNKIYITKIIEALWTRLRWLLPSSVFYFFYINTGWNNLSFNWNTGSKFMASFTFKTS